MMLPDAVQEIQRCLANSLGEIGMPWPPDCGEPVPLDRIILSLGLMHVERPALNRKDVLNYLGNYGITPEGMNRSETPLSGFLYANRSLGFVFVNHSDILLRRRFSAAHELGHFILHFRRDAGPEEDFIKADDQALLCEGEATGVVLDRIEREANQFAAELLMPEAVVRQRAEELGRRCRMNESFLKHRLASELLVSREAMYWRLRSLDLAAEQVEGGAE